MSVLQMFTCGWQIRSHTNRFVSFSGCIKCMTLNVWTDGQVHVGAGCVPKPQTLLIKQYSANANYMISTKLRPKQI